MKYKFSPQRNDEKIIYDFNNDIVTATYKGKTEIFDFSGMPDGVGNVEAEVLEINPILKAERTNGILYIELLNFIGADASYEERFPTVQEVL